MTRTRLPGVGPGAAAGVGLWALLLLAPPPAAAAGPATVSGTVLHGLTGDPVGGAPVALLVPGPDGQLAEIARRPAGPDGSFAFQGPSLLAGQPFVLVAFHGDVPYPTGTLEVGRQSAVLIEVYESTDRSDALVVTADHHFVAASAAGLEVARLVTVRNRGEQTYVGHSPGPDWQVTQFVLPGGLTDLHSHTGALHRMASGRYADTQPLPPGETPIAFTYRVPAEAFDGQYRHQVVYPTEVLDLYLQPPDLPVSGPFEDLGLVSLHDRQYRHLRRRGLAPGERVLLPLPVGRPVRGLLKWMALGLGLLGAGAAILAASGTPAAARAGSCREREARRRAVLEELARLDQTPAAHRRREELMVQAVALYRALEREG